MHVYQCQSLKKVGYLIIISPTSQSLWITHLLCVINPFTSILVVILHDYRVTTHLTIITFSGKLVLITLAIFHMFYLPLEIITSFIQKLTIRLSIIQVFNKATMLYYG